MFLMIENPGEAPLEAFTVLGLSTARGNSACIGQFGSGNKHAVNLLLRKNISPVIYSGREKMSFTTETAYMGKKKYEKVLVQLGNAKPKDCGWCLEYGELDWTNVNMALREFVSNAIDAGSINDVNIDIVETPRAKTGYTRVFVPMCIEVKQFFLAIKDIFLHFDKSEKLSILNKKEEGPAKIYRKGVFVCQLRNTCEKSYFDYNCGEELHIDESRNLDNYSAKPAAAELLVNDFDKLCELIGTFGKGQKWWEYDFSEYYLCNRNNLKDAWTKVFGTSTIALSQIEVDVATRKGHRAIIVPESWYNALSKAKVDTVLAVVNHVERSSNVIAATKKTQSTFDSVWNWLSELNMTNGKQQPKLLSFEGLMDGGELKMGYYIDGCVYINTESESNPQTMLEELAHYITGATDNSRDFQDFAFRAATNACKVLDDLDLI